MAIFLTLISTNTSISRRLFFISLPIALIAGVIYAGVMVYLETKSLKQTQQAQVKDQISQLSEIMAIPTWNLDQQFISRYLQRNNVSPYILCIELISDANLEESSPDQCIHHQQEDVKQYSSPIIYEGQYIGVIIASYKIELDSNRLNFILLSRIPTGIIALLTVFLSVFWVFRRGVFVPLQKMTSSIETFQSEGTVIPVIWDSYDEIGTLNRAINKAQLKQLNHDKVLTSEKEKAEVALNELTTMQAKLVQSEKMASLGGLVAGISHEINTPIGVAKTSASHVDDELKKLAIRFSEGSLTKGNMEEFIEQFTDGMRLITANLDRANQLMTNFKQVSADQSHDEIRIINLKTYLEETIYALKPNLRGYKISVSLDCESNLILETFPGAYSQLITNLIMNSLNHAYNKDEQGLIGIKVIEKKDTININYTDDGKGMNEYVLSKIYEPFFTTKRGSGGTGLGMHIIYNLVTIKLQGGIEASSIEGQGSTFSLTLPKTLQPLIDRLSS
jgi:two-component system NtrC family sensor kinase